MHVQILPGAAPHYSGQSVADKNLSKLSGNSRAGWKIDGISSTLHRPSD